MKRVALLELTMSIEPPSILSAVRTPIGKFQGGLAGFSAPELGGKAVSEAIADAGTRLAAAEDTAVGHGLHAARDDNFRFAKRNRCAARATVSVEPQTLLMVIAATRASQPPLSAACRAGLAESRLHDVSEIASSI